MANYNDLITAIDSVIKTNNRREITGQLLQNVLNTMVGSLGENYQLAGFATPTTNPHQPDQNIFYVASQAGVYTQFDNIVLGDGISFLMWKNGAWTSQTISNVTQSWVQQNFVSKEWFRKVFRVYDEDGLEIVPNDMDSVVDNIKAMVGLWTNEYLSALGMGRDGGGSIQTLAQLNDVQLGALVNGDALVYNTAIHKWENKQIQTGVDMSAVWAALLDNTNEQINASHLATALSGYVTTEALGTALQNYATQSWVNQNFITVEWFDKLFQLYNGNEDEANKIAPNGALPVDQTQLNIEAMFGFWTKKYISALGQGDNGSAGSGDVTWELLASQATGGRTIHLSYISAALASYLTTNGYPQTSAIADMATRTWVGQQGFLTSSSLSNYYTKTEVDALPRIKAITLGSDGCLSFTWQNNTSTIADYSHEHSWFELLDRPDTLAGFGITDAVKQVNIGNTGYSPTNGVITLPAYPTIPTKVSAFSNDAGYATQTWVGQQGYLTSHQSLDYINWLGNATAMSGTSRFDWTGLRLYGVYNNGYPTTYGNVIRVKGWGSGELLLGWNGDNTTAHIYYHSQRDTDGSSWGDWVTIIDSSNIGSQSVSYANSAGSATSAGYASSAGNADTVDGYHESAFLHLSGGSMSGKLGLMSNAYDGRNGSYGLNCNNSDIVGLNSLWMTDESDDWTEGIHYYRGDTGGWDSIRAYRGTFYLYANSGASYASLYVGNLYSTGAVSALSDIRHKEIVRNTNLQVEQIAAMRSVIYRKKDSNDNTLYAGSIAQDWQSILPQVVSVADNDEHTQSLQYGVAALIAVITTARKVAEHEQKIKEQAQKISELEQVCSFLKKENIELKDKVNKLNVA